MVGDGRFSSLCISVHFHTACRASLGERRVEKPFFGGQVHHTTHPGKATSRPSWRVLSNLSSQSPLSRAPKSCPGLAAPGGLGGFTVEATPSLAFPGNRPGAARTHPLAAVQDTRFQGARAAAPGILARMPVLP